MYPANQMAGSLVLILGGLDFVAQSCINHGIIEGWPGIREKLEKSGVIYYPCFSCSRQRLVRTSKAAYCYFPSLKLGRGCFERITCVKKTLELRPCFGGSLC